MGCMTSNSNFQIGRNIIKEDKKNQKQIKTSFNTDRQDKIKKKKIQLGLKQQTKNQIQIDDDSIIIELGSDEIEEVIHQDVQPSKPNKNRIKNKLYLQQRRIDREIQKQIAQLQQSLTQHHYSNEQLIILIKEYLLNFFDEDLKPKNQNYRVLLDMTLVWHQWLDTKLINKEKLILVLVESLRKIKKVSKFTKHFKEFMSQVQNKASITFSNIQIQQQKIECEICADVISLQKGAFLDCGHTFHFQCMKQYLKVIIQGGITNIKCPYEGCSKKMYPRDVEDYLQESLKSKYFKFQINNYVDQNGDVSWCPTPNCTVAFQNEEEMTTFHCEICKKSYCLTCRCEYHKDLSCKEYQELKNMNSQDKIFVMFVKGAKFKQCPKCKFWVERSKGCSTMKCRCGQQFCYECGGVTCPHGKCTNNNK